ncbi:MAG: ATP-dependent Clp protease adaptor ClpS [Deltaproteobacteria bacterium]|nr:ATP-dependent Clp protease adaptor ClpS [Deltaproteobacteria bacterium]
MAKLSWEPGGTVEAKPRIKPKKENLVQPQRPKMYRVLIHNDDYTTQTFVVQILVSVFHHTLIRAREIMLHVHHNGIGVAGIYTKEVAETKIHIVNKLAEKQGFPLLLTMEPDESNDSDQSP